MARRLDQPRRGQIWWHEFRPPDKPRPVLVLSRQEAPPQLRTVIVVPITSTARGLPTEVTLGTDDGLRHESAINLDHIQTVEKRSLRRFTGTLSDEKMREVCRALAVATGCDFAA